MKVSSYAGVKVTWKKHYVGTHMRHWHNMQQKRTQIQLVTPGVLGGCIFLTITHN
jgi:hypothetical protein